MLKQFGAVAILACLIIGCGGAGDTSNLPSQYVGSWTGNWSSPDANNGGTITFTVAADGSLTGTISTKTASGTLGGLINNKGSLDAVGSFTSSGGNMIIGGAVVMSSGRISSNFSYVSMGVQYGGSFDCGAASGSTGSTASTGSTGG